jgi:hypothetical protein
LYFSPDEKQFPEISRRVVLQFTDDSDVLTASISRVMSAGHCPDDRGSKHEEYIQKYQTCRYAGSVVSGNFVQKISYPFFIEDPLLCNTKEIK